MRRVWWLLVAGVCLALVGCASGPTTAATGPVPTATATVPAPTATVEALHASPSQGWVTVPALRFAENIAFAPSDPLTGYACGNAQIGTSASLPPLELSVTHDGGRTWSSPVVTSASGKGCDFSINPHDPNDLVMDGWSCFTACSPFPHPYRSHNGGKTWTALTFDQTQWPATSDTSWVVSAPVWIGNTACFVVEAPGAHGAIPRPLHAFVSNTSGGLLSAPNDALYAVITDPDAIPDAIWAHNAMLVVRFDTSSTVFAQSTDSGATWQTFTPAGVSGFLETTDGVTGIAGSGLVQSSDGGVSWSQLPARPSRNDTDQIQDPFNTADGSVLFVGPQKDIWLLEPGASTWQNVAPLITDKYGTAQQILTFSTDAAGHPVIAWSQAASPILNGIAQPSGVAYHALG